MILLLLDIIFLFFIYQYLKIKLKKKKKEKIYNLLIFSKKERLISSLIIFLFFITYIILFRIFRLWLNNNVYVDFKIILYFLKLVILKIGLYYFIVYITFSILILFQIKKFFDLWIKYHFLRLYYVFLFFYLEKLIKKIILFDIFVVTLTKSNLLFYSIFYFFRDYFLKLIIIIFFFKGLIYNDGLIYIGYTKYYVIYYLILLGYKFLLKFVIEFDIGFISLYNKNLCCITKTGLEKLFLYQKYLLYNDKTYIFMNSNFYCYFKDKKNYIFFFICCNNNLDNLKNIFFYNKNS